MIGRHLASLAAARAVSEHPAPAEADRRGQGLAVVGEGGVVLVLLAAALDGLPAGADAVARREMALMGLAPPGRRFRAGRRTGGRRDDAFRQHGAIGRRRMRDGGHCGGLHQGRGMDDGARNPDGVRPPGLVGSRAGGTGVGGGNRRAGLDRQLGHRPPLMGWGCGRGPRRGLRLGRT